MKKLLVICFLAALLASTSFAQNESFAARLQKDQVPAMVIKSLAKDFPQQKIADFFGVPLTVVANQLAISAYENEDQIFDTYVINITGENGLIRALYDRGGNLLSTTENLTDAALPQTVQTAITQKFPGWKIEGDKMVMTSVQSHKPKMHYKVTLSKGDEVQHAVFSDKGKILRKEESRKEKDRDRNVGKK